MGSSFSFHPGTIVALDRGYADYKLFARWTAEEIYFVTRLKDNAVYEVAEECAVPENRGILSDRLIRFTADKAREDCPCLLRRIAVWDTENEREIILLTNHLEFGATTIAAIYRDRWKIGVSSQGHIVQSVRDRPRPKDSGLVAGEAPWRESKTAEPSDNILGKEYAQRTRLQRAGNAEVASLHESGG